MWDAKEQATYLLTQYDELKEALRDLTKMETLLEQGKVLDGESSRMLSRKSAFFALCSVLERVAKPFDLYGVM